jgi:ribonuclease P protein component
MSNMSEHTFKLSLSKPERLRNVKQIDFLFKNATSIKGFPLVFSYLLFEKPQQAQIQALFAAPKRNFKKAVDRNRIKRVMRDRLRLLKPELTEALNGKYIQFALIYTSRELPDYLSIDKSLKKIIAKLHDSTRA